MLSVLKFFNPIQKACDEYRLHFKKEFGENLPVFELSVTEQLAYRIMGRILYRNLKRQIPVERHVSSWGVSLFVVKV